MATNRYIGARYVPIFAGDWDNTQEYEPLTIVSYQGDSYTSRGYVPTGIAISNTQYWAKTGDFNQQVANLQSSLQLTDGRVQDIEGDVHELENDVEAMYTNFVTRHLVKSVTVEAGQSAESYFEHSAEQGYKGIAITGFDTRPFTLKYISVGDGNIYFGITNTSDSSQTADITVDVLYFKY